MPRDEIIADIQAQIRKGGGDYGAWCVGTAQDSHGTLFTRHETEDLHDGWIYREAFTPGVARDVRDYFVTQCGTDATWFRMYSPSLGRQAPSGSPPTQ